MRKSGAGSTGLLVALALLVSAPACGPSDNEPAPPALVSAETVGGQRTDEGRAGMEPASPCGPDGPGAWTGSSGGAVRTFERDVSGGGTENVLVGVWPGARDTVKALGATSIESDRCSAENWSATPVAANLSFPATTFETRFPAQAEPGREPTPVSRLRVYTWISGRVVTVWLERNDGSRPSQADLISLLDEQSDLVEASSPG